MTIIWQSIKFIARLLFLPLTIPLMGKRKTHMGGYTILFDTRLHGRLANNYAEAQHIAQSEGYNMGAMRVGGGGGGSLLTLDRRIVDFGGGGHGGGLKNPTQTMSYGGGYGYANVGWRINDARRWRVYPFFAYGGSGYGLGITDTTPEATKNIDANNGNATLSSGIALDLMLPIWRIRPLIGFRVGATVLLATPDSPRRIRPYLQVIGGMDVERRIKTENDKTENDKIENPDNDEIA